MRRHLLIGTGAGILLIGGYVGLLALWQGWNHAVEQAAQMWYWLLALAVGFGIQAGLFSFIRKAMREHRAATGSVAASGGVSAGSMAACCAHHLSDILPAVGLTGAAAFLVRYQLFFLVAGVFSNAVGITIMLETIQKHGLSPVLERRKLNLGRVKKAAMVSSGVALAVTFFLR